MRMSVMFAVVALLTGINLLYNPIQPLLALWGQSWPLLSS
jgi:hypothetical protein